MNLSINIKDESKVKPLLDFLKSLDFVEIKKEKKKKLNEVGPEMAKKIDQAMEDYKNGKTTTFNAENFDSLIESL